MMTRNEFIEEMLERLEKVISDIEDFEVNDPDFKHARKVAEKLHEEIDDLHE